MSWINAFELLCYLIVALMLTDLIRRKDCNSLFTFGAAAMVGFTMELLAVAVTDIYYYNPDPLKPAASHAVSTTVDKAGFLSSFSCETEKALEFIELLNYNIKTH